MSSKFKFDVSNFFVYFIISVILIFILVYINNYYFYSHVERTSKRQAIQLEKILVELINKKQFSSEKELINFIDTWSDYSYYNNGIKVIDSQNIVHIIREKKKWDKSAYTYLEIDIKKLINKKSDGFILNSKTVNSEVLWSVFNSMTFSIFDIYEDISKNIISEIDGEILDIDFAAKPVYDNLININGVNYVGLGGAKNLIVKDFGTNEIKEIYIPLYNELLVQKGMKIKNGDILAKGTIHTALNNLKYIYWYRSRPFIGFTIFTLIMVYLFNRRIKLLKQIEEELKIENLRIEEENKIAIEELENQVSKAIDEKDELLQKQNKLENEYKLVCNQFKQYESFVKFAFKETSIDELLEKNRVILGNMFRLIAEKIVYSIFNDNIRPFNRYTDSLDSCLKEIIPLNILSKSSINALFAVKNFGNENSHYTNDDKEISLSKTIVIAKELVDVIEEYFSLETNLIKKV